MRVENNYFRHKCSNSGVERKYFPRQCKKWIFFTRIVLLLRNGSILNTVWGLEMWYFHYKKIVKL